MKAPESTRVLLIDDDDLSRAVLELHLSAAGYEITEVASGDAAVALLAERGGEGFDVILSDLQMPGLHGPKLAVALRAAMTVATPLLAMSGSRPAAESFAGFDGFLLKPFTPEEFAAEVRGLGGAETQEMADEDAASATVLDEETFAQLQSMMKPAQMAEIFRLSLVELDKHLDRMQRALADGDGEGLRASAHAMKGGFSILGATEMRDLGAVLEAGRGSPPDDAATLREIPLAAERLRRMLTSRGLSL